MAFDCTIVTPEQQLLSDVAEQVIIPAHDGEIGILTDHAPTLFKVGVGKLRVDLKTGKSLAFYVEGGVAQVNDNKVTVLTDSAVAVDALTSEQARQELAAATALPASDPMRARAIERATVKQRLTSR